MSAATERLRRHVASYKYTSTHRDNCLDVCGEVDSLQARNGVLEAALHEIAKGKGRFSLDPLEHAGNTIEDMKEMAVAAAQEMKESGCCNGLPGCLNPNCCDKP